MRDANNDKGKVYRAVALVLLFVFLVSAALLLLKMWEKRQGRFILSDTEETSVEYNGKKYELKKDIESFLVIGLDRFEDQTVVDSYNNDQQADFLMLRRELVPPFISIVTQWRKSEFSALPEIRSIL